MLTYTFILYITLVAQEELAVAQLNFASPLAYLIIRELFGEN
jgi:hypothetical protein